MSGTVSPVSTNGAVARMILRAVVCGGNDFIGKPFLPIEITVKALTFAWEGRLRKISDEKPVEAQKETAGALLAA